jgi:hypothetical protein
MPTDPTPWPYHLTDPARAIHLADEPDCPYDDLARCPYEATVRKVLAAYAIWTGHQPTTETTP